MRDYYTPGEVAERFDLTLDTLRYYEKAGLLRRVDRAPSGHRRYRTDDVELLDMIRCLRETDMSIARLREFTELVRDGDHTVPARLEMLQSHQERLDERIAEMRQCQKTIQHKIEFYRGRSPSAPRKRPGNSPDGPYPRGGRSSGPRPEGRPRDPPGRGRPRYPTNFA